MTEYLLGLSHLLWLAVMATSALSAQQKRIFLRDDYCISPVVNHGAIVKCAGSTYHYIGTQCTVSCDQGYMLEQGGRTGAVTCQQGGHWSSSTNCIDASSAMCSEPPAVQNGLYVCSSTTYSEGTSCQLYCSQGHQINGNEIIVCGNMTKWSIPGSCIESQCPDPPQIQMGQYVCPTKSYPHGTSCYLQCDGGYRPVSDGVNITCRQDETWTPTTACIEGCVPGTFSKQSPSGESYCEGCSQGTYQPLKDRSSCIPCPAGWSTESTGAIDVNSCLSLCHPGTSSTTGVEPCHLCLPGTYQNATGGLVCLDCPVGLTTKTVGSTKCVSE